MKKLFALILTLVILVTLAACGDNSYIEDGEASIAQTGILQGAAGSAGAKDAAQAFEREEETDSLQETVNPAYTKDAEKIFVDITAANAYVLNTDSNSVIYERNSDEPIAPASTAKMLTALTVLEYCLPNDIFTVGEEINMIAPDSSRAWLSQGDKLTVKQLLVAILLPSGNDAAYTLAVNSGRIIAGKNDIGAERAVKVFVEAMNQKAAELGAASSHFTNPDGYDEYGQHTTAFDLAQIAMACLDNEVLAEIMGRYRISDTWVSGREVTYSNTNELINPSSRYYYSEAIGLKTGSTEEAGSCLVSAAVINERTYICVVMGAAAGSGFSDSLTIYNSITPTIVLPKVSDNAPIPAPERIKSGSIASS